MLFYNQQKELQLDMKTTFIHCPKCGGLLLPKDYKLLVCTSCAFEFYQNPKACNAVILENPKKEILLVKRKDEPRKGFWDLPGGFMEINESAEEAASREVWEEVGLKVENLKYFASYADRYLYRGDLYHTICLSFYGQVADIKPVSGDDAAAAKFFHPKKIPFNQLSFKSTSRALRHYLRTISYDEK